jgi:hypothetical protein
MTYITYTKPTKPVDHCMHVAALYWEAAHLALSVAEAERRGHIHQSINAPIRFGSMIASMRVSTLRGPSPWFANRDRRWTDGSLCGRRDPEHTPKYGPGVLFEPTAAMLINLGWNRQPKDWERKRWWSKKT